MARDGSCGTDGSATEDENAAELSSSSFRRGDRVVRQSERQSRAAVSDLRQRRRAGRRTKAKGGPEQRRGGEKRGVGCGEGGDASLGRPREGRDGKGHPRRSEGLFAKRTVCQQRRPAEAASAADLPAFCSMKGINFYLNVLSWMTETRLRVLLRSFYSFLFFSLHFQQKEYLSWSLYYRF